MQAENVTNVADVAKMTAGVTLMGASGSRNETRLIVRGHDSTKVPVYIDGIPVYVPYDARLDLNRFTTVDLAQIDISKGASSVLYGPNSLGGAVNLISQKPTKELEAELFWNGKFGNTKGENKKTMFDSGEGFRLGTKQDLFYFQVSGSLKEKYNGPKPGDVDFSKDHSYSDKGRDKKISLRAGFTPNDTDEYSITYVKQKAEKTSRLYEGTNSNNSDRYWWWPGWDKETWYFLSNTQFDGWYIKSRLFYDKYENQLANMTNYRYNMHANGGQGWVSYYDDYSWGGSVEVGMDITQNNMLKIMPSFKEDNHKERNLYPLASSRNEPWQKSKDRMYSLAFEDIQNFGDSTTLTLGLRYDKRKSSDAEEYGTSQWNSTTSLYNFPTKNDDAWTYQALIEHDITKDDTIYASFARKTYFPTMADRYSSRFNRNIQNPDLKPEQSLNYELGYKKSFENADLRTAVFYSDIKDKIASVNGVVWNGHSYAQNQNIGDTDVYGAELETNANFGDFALGGNYTYMHYEAKKDGTKYQLSNIPKHQIYAYAEYKILSQLKIRLSEYAQSKNYTESDNNSGVKYYARGFAVTNLKISYSPIKQLDLEFGVENLFDKAYAYTEGFYENGRTFMLNARYKY
ncbi:MAG: TonB-dependent receptor [Campylobacter sp.]|nr:TonB-dependent receptor [Campylobacter sp.]